MKPEFQKGMSEIWVNGKPHSEEKLHVLATKEGKEEKTE